MGHQELPRYTRNLTAAFSPQMPNPTMSLTAYNLLIDPPTKLVKNLTLHPSLCLKMATDIIHSKPVLPA